MTKSLKKLTIEGIGWRGAASFGEQFLQIIFTAILARLLTTADFGLVAMALLVTRFASTVTQIGFGSAIIQSQEVTSGQISAIFYFQLALNFVMSCAVFLGANLAAGFFEEPQLIPLIKVLALIIFLQTFQFPNILLQKNMDFKRYSTMEIASLLLANITAIALAFGGYGVWSLVWRILIQRLSFGVFSWILTKWKPVEPDFRGTMPLIKFGLDMLGAHVIYYFSENLIGIVTSKYLGKEIMGLFNIAYNLAIIPASKVRTILTTVLTPGFSKLQYNKEYFKAGFEKAFKYTTLIFIPFMMLLAGTAKNLIPIIYGLKWYQAGEMLMILSFVGMIRGLGHILRSAIIASGRSRIILLYAFTGMAFSLPLMIITLDQYGIYGLLFSYLIGAVFSFAFIVYHVNKYFEDNYLLFKNSIHSFIMGLIILIICFLVDYLPGQGYEHLAIKMLLALVVIMSFIGTMYPQLLKNLINFRTVLKK